jgi:NTE family protein
LADNRNVTLVLGGGNALGAYQLGACRRLLHERVEPERIIGTSIGAVTGAILIGAPLDQRLARLEEFWARAATPLGHFPGDWPGVRERRTEWSGLGALLSGRPGLFHGALSRLPTLALRSRTSLADHRPLARTLARLIDFQRVNSSDVDLHVATLDMETGEEVWFGNRTTGIAPEHLLAATAFPPLYPPIEIGGRLLCDAGLANNLPVDRAFALEQRREMLCIAVDLFSLSHGRPRSLDGTVARAQDIVFASQSRRAISAIARERARAASPEGAPPPAVLAHVAFRAPAHQRGLKSLDYSRASIRERADRGSTDMAAMLRRVALAPWDEPLLVLQ